MPVDYQKLGDRIRVIRSQQGISQEKLAEITDLARENINRFENASKGLSLESLVAIANALHVSVDDLLVDSLNNPASTADSDLHRLLLDCNKVEEQILTKNAQELKKILYGLGI